MAIRRMLLVGALVGFVGCTRSEPGGGPKRASSFTIHGPMMATAIHQGEAKTVSLSLSRGSEFKQDVKLKAEAPVGVDATLSERDVKPSEKGDVNLRVSVGNGVKPGEHVIHVVGTPASGTPTTLDVKIKVEERSNQMKLALHGPSTTLTLKQGEAANVKINLEPNAKYTASVKLHAEAPTGLKAEMKTNEVKAAERSEAELRIAAEKTAAPGEYAIRVTGTGDAATVSAVDVRVKVIAK